MKKIEVILALTLILFIGSSNIIFSQENNAKQYNPETVLRFLDADNDPAGARIPSRSY